MSHKPFGGPVDPKPNLAVDPGLPDRQEFGPGQNVAASLALTIATGASRTSSSGRKERPGDTVTANVSGQRPVTPA